MRATPQFAIGLALALAPMLVLCPGAGAQSHGRGISAPTAQTRAASSSTSIRTVPVQRVALNSRSNVSFTAAPGLGFDYVHLAAITRGLTRENLRVVMPVRRVRFGIGLTPFIPIAFPAPVIVVQEPVLVTPADVDEEDAGVAAAPVPQTAPVQRARPAQQSPSLPPPEQAEPAPPAPPNQDIGEYILVKRDGTLAFAVAFSSSGDQLVYVTRQGVRRSLPLSQLDPEATRRINEERGTSIQLPR